MDKMHLHPRVNSHFWDVGYSLSLIKFIKYEMGNISANIAFNFKTIYDVSNSLQFKLLLEMDLEKIQCINLDEFVFICIFTPFIYL